MAVSQDVIIYCISTHIRTGSWVLYEKLLHLFHGNPADFIEYSRDFNRYYFSSLERSILQRLTTHPNFKLEEKHMEMLKTKPLFEQRMREINLI